MEINKMNLKQIILNRLTEIGANKNMLSTKYMQQKQKRARLIVLEFFIIANQQTAALTTQRQQLESGSYNMARLSLVIKLYGFNFCFDLDRDFVDFGFDGVIGLLDCESRALDFDCSRDFETGEWLSYCL